ncbi:MAG TPA: hypothetical protein PLL32_02270, partial [Anaeromyxobacteraceae bacterium]|nr:hypothetical protein [Anaeromyxobacteraceae bacterium]
PDTCFRENFFTITGMLHDPNTPVGSPMSVTRATFNRNDGTSQVDVMARASSGPGQAAPKLTAAGQAVSPVLMAGPTILGDWYAQGIPVPSTDVPTQLTVTNSADVPPTSITSHVTDEITIRSATYSAGTLTVVATSSDKGDITVNPVIPPSVLSLAGYPAATRVASNANDRAEVTFTAAAGPVPPAFVRVVSNHGALATLDTSLSAAAPYPAGVPFVGDDTADVIQNTVAAIPIDVLANDVAPAGAPINSGTLTIVPPLPLIGTASVSSGQIFYRAPSVTGTATIRYTVQNSVGTSNVGTVTVSVLADPAGPVPSAVNDPSSGAINVTAGQSVAINVLANDNGNGGTLNPASVTVTAAPASGTTTVNATTGVITYNSAAAGTYTFRYRVSNLPSANGTVQTSNEATVTVTVAAAENLTVRTPVKCALPAKWNVQGTSNVSAGNTITIYSGTTATGTVLGTAAVVNGAWQWQTQNVACVNRISLKSSLNTKIENIAVQVK